ncbi:MAG: 50S ribosomal protein L23 [Ignavibacteria bacterium GWF2_33_9]|nr:MAG: 50S ribosomal protein L23 [Ignavibacteria bacterium GWF2_33_9]
MIEIIKRPIITEKAMNMGHHRQYAFEVDRDSTKIQIKQAIEELYEVKVDNVRTLNVKGKNKTRFTRKGLQRGFTKLRKKAYVTLKEGFSIEIVSGAQEE